MWLVHLFLSQALSLVARLAQTCNPSASVYRHMHHHGWLKHVVAFENSQVIEKWLGCNLKVAPLHV
jgi:hypothetical protein